MGFKLSLSFFVGMITFVLTLLLVTAGAAIGAATPGVAFAAWLLLGQAFALLSLYFGFAQAHATFEQKPLLAFHATGYQLLFAAPALLITGFAVHHYTAIL